MADTFLKIEQSDKAGVLLVTLARPPVNALSLAFFKELKSFFENIDASHPDACAIVLTGEGKFFSAGADVKELAERTTESQLARSVFSRGTFAAIRNCPVPVVCALNGAAIGAGTVVAASCDVILASETATMALTEVMVGVLGGVRHTNRMLPEKIARYMALTGRKVDAAALFRHGAVQDVYPPETLIAEALELAGDIARHSPTTIRLMKEAINLTEDLPLTEGYRVEQLFTTLASSMPDSKEASSAFLEKRTPVWQKGVKF